MSIGSLGIVGSLVGTSLAQKSAEVEKIQRDASDASRQTDASARAESAEGIGQTSEDSRAEERDADGRRLWERNPPKPIEADDASTLATPSPKDPDGISGGIIDLTG
jgi:hypothetical protein